MSRKNKYGNKQPDLLDQSSALFERTEIPFKKSSEEIWKDLYSRCHSIHGTEIPTRHVVFGSRTIALAATLTLLLSVGTFLRLYRVKTICPQGENITFELPDGSLAELNEQTTLYVHPLWWPVSREVHLEGEAFFNVKEGKRFAVHAPLGTTEVLGTTFTIYAGEERFSVTCHSGRVQVNQASSDHSLILSQNERAELNSSGELEVRKVKVDRFIPAWKKKLLMFTSTPLRQVFDEIEDQYGIRIVAPEDLNQIYTGSFPQDQPVEKILSLICRPFDLVYEKRSGSEYHIIPSTVD
jgi:ferric-dicitrate binding protein FerR (iron transport regulator)